jgi:hypothetical protein
VPDTFLAGVNTERAGGIHPSLVAGNIDAMKARFIEWIKCFQEYGLGVGEAGAEDQKQDQNGQGAHDDFLSIIIPKRPSG